MQLSSLLLLPLAALASAAVQVRYDPTYDNGSLSTLILACSDGVNGLYSKGYPTLGSIPSFPNIGAAAQIPGWNSPECGTCYRITYGGRSLYITAVDHAGTGFVLSKTAMDTLTGGMAQQLGVVNADFTKVANSNCKL